MIVVFDAACNICTFYVRFLSARDRHARLSFVPAASEEGRHLLSTRNESPDDPSTMLVLDGDRWFTRSDAVIAAVEALGGLWRGAHVFAFVPLRLRNRLYAGFARRRYRWFGRVADCGPCAADTLHGG